MSKRSDIVPRLDPALVAAKDASIREIALEMSTGSWHQYRSAVEFAAKLGLAESTVADYAKEAARMLRISWTGDDARVAVLERIQQLGRDAVERREEVVGRDGAIRSLSKPDFRSAVHAAEVLASILGMTRQQHEMRVTYERMSEEQLTAEVMRFIEARDEHMPAGAREYENERAVQVTVVAADGEAGGGGEGVERPVPGEAHTGG